MTQEPAAHGPKPELIWLPLAGCHVDNRYQRTLESDRSQALVARLAAAWRWASCGALLAVADGKDRYLLLDGQHRAEAARRIGIKELPALVVAGLSLKDQAAAFVGANLDRVAVNGFALHHARLVAGDERAGLVDRICRAADVSIPKYPIPADNLKPGQTLALASIAQLAQRLGEGGGERDSDGAGRSLSRSGRLPARLADARRRQRLRRHLDAAGARAIAAAHHRLAETPEADRSPDQGGAPQGELWRHGGGESRRADQSRPGFRATRAATGDAHGRTRRDQAADARATHGAALR